MSAVEQESIYGSSAGDTFESRPIGEYLRRQRILRGISAEELAELTRIPLRSLERLEDGQFDGDTDGFVRGFVRTVAAALGLDTDDAVARMLQEPQASTWDHQGGGRTLKQLAAVSLFSLLVLGMVLGLRSIWGAVLGDASDPSDREVVIWRDPVRALAEANGALSGGTAEIDPGAPLERTPPSPPAPPDAPATGDAPVVRSR